MGDSGEEEASGEGEPIREQREQGEPGEERGAGGQQGPRLGQPQRKGGQSEPAGSGPRA